MADFSPPITTIDPRAPETGSREECLPLHVYERVMAASPHGVLAACGVDRRVIYVNPAFERLTGLAAREFLGQKAPDVLPGLGDEAHASLHAALEEGRETAALIRGTRPDGRPYCAEVAIVPVRDESGVATHVVVAATDVTEQRASEEFLGYLAYNDPLTRLPNRRLFHDRLTQALAYARRNARQVAVMFLDLDNFKLINDTLRHHTGDQVLRLVATRLMDALRKSDTAARLGGDEFAIVLPDLDGAESASSVANKILEEMASPFPLEGRELYVGASIGLALYPGDGNDVETLLANADTAMYHAKARGRNNYQFFSAELNAIAAARVGLESALRRGLDRNEFRLYYQPQLDMHTGRVTGLEALLRWQHPELGLMPPAHFIPLAEETGLIVPIGDWVLRTACRQASAWRDDGFGNLAVTVNLSSRQFRRQGVVESVRLALEEAKLDAGCLELEITESVMMEHADAALVALDALRALGCRIAMDDFGTGYSSLSQLSRFPVDNLKIDRSFVQQLSRERRDTRSEGIVMAIIALARSAKMKVTAEGVENDAQLAFLRSHRCDRMQGFHFSPPVPGEDVPSLLAWRGTMPGSTVSALADGGLVDHLIS